MNDEESMNKFGLLSHDHDDDEPLNATHENKLVSPLRCEISCCATSSCWSKLYNHGNSPEGFDP